MPQMPDRLLQPIRTPPQRLGRKARRKGMRNVIRFDIPKAYVLNANQARRMHWAKKAKNAKAIRTLGYIAGDSDE